MTRQRNVMLAIAACLLILLTVCSCGDLDSIREDAKDKRKSLTDAQTLVSALNNYNSVAENKITTTSALERRIRNDRIVLDDADGTSDFSVSFNSKEDTAAVIDMVEYSGSNWKTK